MWYLIRPQRRRAAANSSIKMRRMTAPQLLGWAHSSSRPRQDERTPPWPHAPPTAGDIDTSGCLTPVCVSHLTPAALVPIYPSSLSLPPTHTHTHVSVTAVRQCGLSEQYHWSVNSEPPLQFTTHSTQSRRLQKYSS